MASVAVEGDGAVLTLAAARAHLRVSAAVPLADLIATAEQAVADEMGRPLIGADGWADAAQVPANVKHAVKLVLTDLYDNRATPLADLAGVRVLIGRYIKPSVS